MSFKIVQNFSPETLVGYEIDSRGFKEITETPKTSSRSWQEAMEGLCPRPDQELLDEILVAKARLNAMNKK